MRPQVWGGRTSQPLPLELAWPSAVSQRTIFYSGVPPGGCRLWKEPPHEFLAPHILPGTSSCSWTPALGALKLGSGECVLWR